MSPSYTEGPPGVRAGGVDDVAGRNAGRTSSGARPRRRAHPQPPMLANQLQPPWQRDPTLTAPAADEIVGGTQVEVGEPGDAAGTQPGTQGPPADRGGGDGEHGGVEPGSVDRELRVRLRRVARRRPRPPPGRAASRAAASSASPSSRSCAAVRASASATPPASTSSSSGSTSRRRRTRVKRGSTLCGSSQKVRPCARHAAAVSARRRPSSGRSQGGSQVAHAGQRPGARAAAEAEQHGLGLVVEGVAEQHGRVGVRAGGAQRGVAGPAGGRLEPAAAVDDHAVHGRRNALGGQVGDERGAAFGGAVLQPVVDHRDVHPTGRDGPGGGEQGRRVGTAGARDEQRRRAHRRGQRRRAPAGPPGARRRRRDRRRSPGSRSQTRPPPRRPGRTPRRGDRPCKEGAESASVSSGGARPRGAHRPRRGPLARSAR